KPIPIVPPEKLAECASWRQALAGGESFLGVETYRSRRDGRQIEVMISAAPLSDGEGAVRSLVLLFEDVTERNRADTGRRQALRELTTLYQIGHALSGELDLERLLQSVTDAATQLSGASFGAFFYNAADDQNGHYTLYTLSGAPR